MEYDTAKYVLFVFISCLFLFCFCFSSHLLSSHFCSLSLLAVTQIRGHIAGSPPPLPTTVLALLVNRILAHRTRAQKSSCPRSKEEHAFAYSTNYSSSTSGLIRRGVYSLASWLLSYDRTDPRISTMPGLRTSGFHRPGTDIYLHQARNAVRYSASRMKGELYMLLL